MAVMVREQRHAAIGTHPNPPRNRISGARYMPSEVSDEASVSLTVWVRESLGLQSDQITWPVPLHYT